MGPLIALGIGLLPTLLGGLFGAKEAPAPPPPPDHTGDLLKAMQDQHKKDMETINRLIDKLDARDRGQQSQIGLGSSADKPASPVAAAQTPSGGGPAAGPAKNPDILPQPEEGGIWNDVLGLFKELLGLVTQLTELVGRLIPGQPRPEPLPIPGMVPLGAPTAKTAAPFN
jgi:hypothetical protein